MKNIIHIYKTFITLLNEKSTITLGEVQHIQRAVKYIAVKENTEKPSQFIKDCQIISDALSSLKKKIQDYQKDLDDLQNKLNNSSFDTKLIDNLHLEYILKLDCMRNRSFSLSEKLEYLHRAYENLIAPYNSLYLPFPTISKRINTSNLMLFFNQELNSSYNLLREHFFRLKNLSDDNVFSTWVFSGYEHVKEIDYDNKVFISLSFWFYEKQIFYPIAFHEIAHSIYMSNELTQIKLTEEEKKDIVDKLLLSPESQFAKSMIYTIYQDIIADFCAYSLSGESYILALFFTGFMQNIYKNFYPDVQIESFIKQKYPQEEERKCSTQHKNLTLLDWAHSSMAKDDNFISFYIRLNLLIELHNKISSNTSIFNEELKGIKTILNLIYPNKQFQAQYNTFENLLSSFQKQKQQYQYTKYFIFQLQHLLQHTVFHRKKLDKIVKHVLNQAKKEFLNNKAFHQILKEQSIESNYTSQYDLFWKQKTLKGDKAKLGRLLRLYNLTKLKVITQNSATHKKLDTIIYELVFFKFYDKLEKVFSSFNHEKQQNPLLEYLDEINQNNFLYAEVLNNPHIAYAFGPYDIAILSQNTTNEVDKYLDELSKTKTFFTERHALFLLATITNDKSTQSTSHAPIDLIISIDARHELSDHVKELYQDLYNTLQDYQNFEEAKIFASMGNESFLLYIEKISFTDIKELTEKLYEIHDIRNISTIVLLNKYITHKLTEVKVHNRNIVLLGKLNKRSSYITSYQNLKQQINSLKGNKYNLYKKYGTYDFIITFDNDTTLEDIKILISKIDKYTEDIQLELQEIMTPQKPDKIFICFEYTGNL